MLNHKSLISCDFIPSALMYSVFGVVLSWGRGVDDELNTVTAGTATGMLYKSSGNHIDLPLSLIIKSFK